MNQGEFKSPVRDLKLSKKQAESLRLELKGWNLLQQNAKYIFS